MSVVAAIVTGAEKAEAKIASLPAKYRSRLVESLKRQWLRVQAYVVKNKLSGDPLHRRTGVLATSINVGEKQTATEFVDAGNSLIARIGTKVRYGRLHEYGGVFSVPAHTRLGHPVREHTVTFPERSFLRSSIRENRSSVLAAIQADMAKGG